MSEWISVLDRLPKPGVEVLCWIDNHVHFGSLNRLQTIDDDGKITAAVFSVTDRDYENGAPSHWMPIPDSPTKEHT